MNKELLEYLSTYVTDNKKEKFDRVLDLRTRFLTVVLENIVQPHNVSAVIRSCECFGVQDVHVIERDDPYKINRKIVMGASKWLSLYKYGSEKNNTFVCLNSLKEKGYKIIATTPHEGNINLEDFPLNQKVALVYGNEKEGLSRKACDMADGFLKVPMQGFTESLNISVCAAVCLHYLTSKIRSSAVKWKLTDEEKDEIRLDWVRSVIRRVDIVEKEFLLKQTK